MKLAIFGLLVAVTVGCSRATADLAQKPAFKGMELYSWKPDGEDWHFSLLVGTNRLKTDEEIKKPQQTVVGIEELKKRLERLAEGENVSWRNLAKQAVPEEMAKELRKFCESKKVKLSDGEPLPNGYAVFFASDSEASLVKPATRGGECIAGPCVTELGNSGNYIFGKIDPKKGLPPHPDHAPGFFLIDSATDKVTTGLDREKWLAELKAVGIDTPQLQPPQHKWPKTY